MANVRLMFFKNLLNRLKQFSKNSKLALLAILILSIVLNTYHIQWGLPGIWHPDTKVFQVLKMAGTLNFIPDAIANPPLHPYLVGLFLIPYAVILKLTGSLPSGVANIFETSDEFIATIFILARLLSAICGTLTVYLTFQIAKKTLNEKMALLSALLLSLTMGFVNLAHFTTPEILFTCLSTAAILSFIAIVQVGTTRCYLTAGLLTGLAILTKYTAVALVIPLFVSHFLAESKHGLSFSFSRIIKVLFNKKLIIANWCFIFVFFLALPFIVGNYDLLKKWLLDTFNATLTARGIPLPNQQWYGYLEHLRNMFGTPLFLFCIGGILYGLYEVITKKNFYTILFLSWVLPVYIFLGSQNLSAMRYIIPIAPILIVLGSGMVSNLIKSGKVVKVTTYFFIWVTVLYSFSYVLTLEWMFANDSRYIVDRWIKDNVSEGSKIDFYHGHCKTLDCHPASWLLPRSIDPRFPNLKYNVRYFEEVEDLSSDFAGFVEKYKSVGGDYIVINSARYIHYSRFPEKFPNRVNFYYSLLTGNFGYNLISRIKFKSPILNPRPEFVYPPMVILKKNTIK